MTQSRHNLCSVFDPKQTWRANLDLWRGGGLVSSKTRANPDRSGIGNVRRRFFGTVTRRFFGTVIRTIEFRDGVFGQRMQSSRSTILTDVIVLLLDGVAGRFRLADYPSLSLDAEPATASCP